MKEKLLAYERTHAGEPVGYDSVSFFVATGTKPACCKEEPLPSRDPYPTGFPSSSALGQRASRQMPGARTKAEARGPCRALSEQTRSKILFLLKATCIFPGLLKPGRSMEL